MIQLVILISTVVHEISGQFDMKCTEEYCTNFIDEKKCPKLNINCMAMNSTHHGIHLKYPDTCNCCDYCLSNLEQGEYCMRGYPGLLPLSIAVCGHGLSCITDNVSTCQRMITKCSQAQDDWDRRRKNGTLGMTEVRPNCDSDGLFAASHCIPGSICFCRAPSGDRMFGEIPFQNSWDEQTMTCGCALNDWKMRNTLDNWQWHGANLTGVFGARCTANGHYDPLQCMSGKEAKCFCVNPVTGRPNKGISPVNLTDIREGYPSCFDSTLHKPGKYFSPCETMIMSSNAATDNTFDNPRCQPDGMFHRLQISGSKMICVDPSGIRIAYQGIEFGANRDTNEADNMNCNCAKNVWLLLESGSTEIPRCCSNGNFELWQCRRNICYCIDNDGNQLGLEVNFEDIGKLSCYNGGNPCPI